MLEDIALSRSGWGEYIELSAGIWVDLEPPAHVGKEGLALGGDELAEMRVFSAHFYAEVDETFADPVTVAVLLEEVYQRLET